VCGVHLLLLLLLLLLTASGYVPGGSDTTLHNTIQYTKTQNNTYTLKTIHTTIITNTITQNYKHNAQKETGVSSNMIKEISVCTIILI
jgi:hypothetical protein